MFHVGQKVVCVNAAKSYPTDDLEYGHVYTIRSLVTEVLFQEGRATGVKLNEIKRSSEVDSDVFWVLERFRPVVERKTDISIFTAMLTPAKADA
jgi:hypothetical protein